MPATSIVESPYVNRRRLNVPALTTNTHIISTWDNGAAIFSFCKRTYQGTIGQGSMIHGRNLITTDRGATLHMEEPCTGVVEFEAEHQR